MTEQGFWQWCTATGSEVTAQTQAQDVLSVYQKTLL